MLDMAGELADGVIMMSGGTRDTLEFGLSHLRRGLSRGDRGVTSAQFLVDSETNLMAAMQGMSMSMPGMDVGKGKAKGDGREVGLPKMDMPSSESTVGTVEAAEHGGHTMPGMAMPSGTPAKTRAPSIGSSSPSKPAPPMPPHEHGTR